MSRKSLKTILESRAEMIAPRAEIDLWPSIQQRLQSHHAVLQQRKGDSDMKVVTRFQWKTALLFALVLITLVFAVSEPARAIVLEWIKIVAGFRVEETAVSPLIGYEEGIVQATEYAIPTMKVPDALANHPFPFNLPAWTPDGYALDENMAIANSKAWVMLNWVNPDGGGIFMLVEKEQPQYNLPAGEESSEEIQINGQPALLIRGDWASAEQWDPTRAVTIYWEKNGLFYRLGYRENQSIQDMDAVILQLVQMAESVP